MEVVHKQIRKQSDFDKDSVKTIAIQEGITAIIGTPKDSKKTQPISFIFVSTSKTAKEDAEKWMKENARLLEEFSANTMEVCRSGHEADLRKVWMMRRIGSWHVEGNTDKIVEFAAQRAGMPDIDFLDIILTSR